MFKLRNLMEKAVITVTKDTLVYDAMAILRKYNITGIPVVNDDMTLAGIITEKDLLRFLYTAATDDLKIQDFMTEEVVSFDAEDSMIDVADCFIKNDFRRVPILENGKVAGIVSKKDIVDYILKMRKVGEVELALQSLHTSENNNCSMAP